MIISTLYQWEQAALDIIIFMNRVTESSQSESLRGIVGALFEHFESAVDYACAVQTR